MLNIGQILKLEIKDAVERRAEPSSPGHSLVRTQFSRRFMSISVSMIILATVWRTVLLSNRWVKEKQGGGDTSLPLFPIPKTTYNRDLSSLSLPPEASQYFISFAIGILPKSLYPVELVKCQGHSKTLVIKSKLMRILVSFLHSDNT